MRPAGFIASASGSQGRQRRHRRHAPPASSRDGEIREEDGWLTIHCPDRVDRLNEQIVAHLAAAGDVLLTSTLDHLVEISAIDWGRDFSYGRSATVVATEPINLVAFPVAALRELMLDGRTVDRAVRRIAHTRLAGR